MRLAQRLRTKHLYPLTAGLFESVTYLEDVKADFADLRQADHAYLVMAEWRKRTRNRSRNEDRDTTAGKMVKILKDAQIDHHLVCLVCEVLCDLKIAFVPSYNKTLQYSNLNYNRQWCNLFVHNQIDNAASVRHAHY